MLLRPSAEDMGHFTVVGECFTYGLMDTEALLGPLPSNYQVQLGQSNSAQYTLRFRDTLTGKIVDEDPRLDKLPEEWEFQKPVHLHANASQFIWKNRVSGEEQNWDPRLSSTALKCRGVKIETLRLV